MVPWRTAGSVVAVVLWLFVLPLGPQMSVAPAHADASVLNTYDAPPAVTTSLANTRIDASRADHRPAGGSR